MPDDKNCQRSVLRTSYGEAIWTKQMVQSLLFNQYDPLGFVTSYTIRGKMIVQYTLAQAVLCKDPIPKDCLRLWESWLMCPQNSKVRIKRRHIQESLDKAVSVLEVANANPRSLWKVLRGSDSLVQNMMIRLIYCVQLRYYSPLE